MKACFVELATHFGPEFDLALSPGKSRARQVVKVLGWVEYGAYLTDMVGALPNTAA